MHNAAHLSMLFEEPFFMHNAAHLSMLFEEPFVFLMTSLQSLPITPVFNVRQPYIL